MSLAMFVFDDLKMVFVCLKLVVLIVIFVLRLLTEITSMAVL